MATNVESAGDGLLVLACGALVRELQAVVELNGLQNVTVECLPASLHNTPRDIPDALRTRISVAKEHFDRILLGYADCGTAGEIDQLCADEGIERLPGAHCYEFFAGASTFAGLHDTDPATFYLTDFLARHFDRLILEGLGINAHPELEAMYFGNYTTVVHLAQTDDARLDAMARAAAERLGLEYRRLATGYGELESAVVQFVGTSVAVRP